MSELTACSAKLLAPSAETLARCEEVERWIAAQPQLNVMTEHVLHGGMYARTIRVDAGVIMTGVQIHVETILVISGDLDMLVGDDWLTLSGYGVLEGCAGRKAVIVTHSPVEMTMIFPTKATTVEDAEEEFTHEPEKLMSRKGSGDTVENGFAIGG